MRLRFSTYRRRFSASTSALGAGAVHWLERFGLNEPTLLTLLAVGVGLLAGLSVLLFYRTIDLAAELISGITSILFVPSALVAAGTLAIGLVVVWLLLHFGTGDSDGENIPDIMHAVTARGGVLHLGRVVIKTIASAVTLGSGGSVGAEGPVAVLGAAVGSRAGRSLRLSESRLKLLLACGAAAGLSGAFGAPIAGMMFALEKLTGGYRTSDLAPIAVASVTAAAVTRVGLGQDQVIRIPMAYHAGAGSDLLLYALVGLAGGVIGVLYARAVWKVPDWLRPLPRWLRLLFAAVTVAVIASQFAPGLWGRGHQGLDLRMIRDQTALLLFALCLAKILATALTLGGGGVGGVFTPALAIGGTFGAAAGTALTLLLPGWGLQPVPFALVGMAAVVAGATHAPLTAVFMVLEMSGDYGLLVPVLLAGTLAYLVAKPLYAESIYTEWLVRRERAAAAAARVSDA